MGAGVSANICEKLMRSVGSDDTPSQQRLVRVNLPCLTQSTSSYSRGQPGSEQPRAVRADQGDGVSCLARVGSFRNYVAAQEASRVTSNNIVASSQRACATDADDAIVLAEQEDAPTEFVRYVQSYYAAVAARGSAALTPNPNPSDLAATIHTEGTATLASSTHPRASATTTASADQQSAQPSSSQPACDDSVMRFRRSVETVAALAPSFSMLEDDTSWANAVSARSVSQSREKISESATKADDTPRRLHTTNGDCFPSHPVIRSTTARSVADTPPIRKESARVAYEYDFSGDYQDEGLSTTAHVSTKHMSSDDLSLISIASPHEGDSRMSASPQPGIAPTPETEESGASMTANKTAFTDAALDQLWEDAARSGGRRHAELSPSSASALPVLDLNLPRRVRRTVNSSVTASDAITLRESATFRDTDTLIAHNQSERPSPIVLPNPSVAKARRRKSGVKFVPTITAFEYA